MADEMSGELSEPAHPVYLEISTDLHEKLCFISTSGAVQRMPPCTLPAQLVKEVLDSPAAYPA